MPAGKMGPQRQEHARRATRPDKHKADANGRAPVQRGDRVRQRGVTPDDHDIGTSELGLRLFGIPLRISIHEVDRELGERRAELPLSRRCSADNEDPANAECQAPRREVDADASVRGAAAVLAARLRNPDQAPGGMPCGEGLVTGCETTRADERLSQRSPAAGKLARSDPALAWICEAGAMEYLTRRIERLGGVEALSGEEYRE